MAIDTSEEWWLGEGLGDGLGDGTGPTFAVELRSDGDSCRLILTGKLSCTSIAALEVQVDQLGCLPCEEVEIDLTALTEMDEVGVKVLTGLRHYVGGRGGRLRVVGATGQVAAMLRRARDGEPGRRRWPRRQPRPALGRG